VPSLQVRRYLSCSWVSVSISISMLRKRPTIQEFGDTAAFVASDRGGGITASVINVNSGISAR